MTNKISRCKIKSTNRINAKKKGGISLNIQKLKGLIVEKETTQEYLADCLGIDKSTFYRKMKNGGAFTVREANLIISSLNLTSKEAVDIFFDANIA
ncbi:XRE family transcriptional regulator [Streptococcus canis]|uniref:XRE family transcriptional regulator n=1 Tax=Streptococcus canis TaxID=1329 RepID=UPI00294B5F3D|nr:XRE family transcriptional regulator [Streptococcus canis]